MKKNYYGISIFSLFLLGCVFVSCKKSSTSFTGSTVAVKQIVEAWRDKTTPVVSDKTKEIINSIVSNLDYTSITKIDLHKTGIIDYLIKIRDQTTSGSNRYLSLIHSSKGYTSQGIYTAENPEQIIRVVQEQKFKKGDNVLQTNITGRPLMAWQTNNAGIDIIKIAKPQKAGSSLSVAGLKKKILSTSQKTDYMADPGATCTNWYWVDYDLHTGNIVDITFLTSTCPNGSGGNTSGAITETQVLDKLESELTETSLKETVSTTQVDAITRVRTYKWQICQAGSWTGYSNEIGSHEFSISENRWNWKTFEHVSVSKTGTIIGGTVDISDISSAANIWPQFAAMQVNYRIEWHLLFRSIPALRSKDCTAGVIYGVNEQ